MSLTKLLPEMEAFLNGQKNYFSSSLSSASTDQINTLNQHLLETIGNTRHLLDIADLNGPQASQASNLGTGAADLFNQSVDSADFSWSGLDAMKSQIDQQLSTVRTELQTFFGPLNDDLSSASTAHLDSLSLSELMAGAKNSTADLMQQLSVHQGPDSTLVEDTLSSLAHVMDNAGSSTAADHLDASALPQDLLSLVDQVPSMDSVVDIDPAGLFDVANVSHTNSGSEYGGDLLHEGLFMPLSDSSGVHAGNPDTGINFDKPA
ncbi:MAG: hypothetical protein ACI90C_000885 [Rhodoferax sp.]|jgi:hypothetical protein